MANNPEVNAITLVVPGLWHAWIEQLSLPEFSVFLSRGSIERVAHPSLAHLLFALFGHDTESGCLPLAAVTAVADDITAAGPWWLRMDPVSWQLDHRTAYLQNPAQLNLSADEEAALLTSINTFLAVDNLQVIAGRDGRWYCPLTTEPLLNSTPLYQVIGQNIADCLPQGEQAGLWNKRLTEIQMLLSQHAVNQRRIEAGKPEINGIWIWGEGRLDHDQAVPWSQVYSDDEVALGLALHHHCAVTPLTGMEIKLNAVVKAGGHRLVVLKQLADLVQADQEATWLQAVKYLDRNVFYPLMADLWHKRIDFLRIYLSPSAVLDVTPRRLRRWWKRCRSMQHLYHSCHIPG